MKTSKQNQRRHDIDWLRILAIMTVFIFHCARFFDTQGWHVKNPENNTPITFLVLFLSQWMMPLFFILNIWRYVLPHLYRYA